MSKSQKSLFEAAYDMITGVTIGTIQTSTGSYTPKIHCNLGLDPSREQGEVIDVESEDGVSGLVKVGFANSISQIEQIGFAGFFSVAAGDGLGTAYEMEKVRLVDVELPSEIVSKFKGPAFGSIGIRDILNRPKSNKPLAALLLKPNTGQPSEYYAELAKNAILAGFDYIKEDELQFNHPACPLQDRVKKIVKAINSASNTTGRKALYAPNITAGSQEQIIHNAKIVTDIGASGVMINVAQVGLDALRLLREADIGVPIHVHRSGHDCYTRGDVGISLNVLSKFYRLAGADLIHTGPIFGDLYSPESVLDNLKAVANDWCNIKKSLPILSRSATSIIQDSIDYIATDKDISEPGNVLFLVDKDVYENIGNFFEGFKDAAGKFINEVHKSYPNDCLTKLQILKKQDCARLYENEE